MRRGYEHGSARMMGCAHYRRAMLANPRDPEPQLREHRESCHDCNLYSARLLRFESRLEHALCVALPSEAALPSDKIVPLRAKSLRAALRSPAYRKGTLAM